MSRYRCTRMESLIHFLSRSLFTISCALSIPHLSCRTIFSFFLVKIIWFSSPSPHPPVRSLSTSFCYSFHLCETLPLCSAACLLYVYLFLPSCLSTTCQFLGGGGLFGDRWWPAFHLDGDPGGEARLCGWEQLLIGRGVCPCHYAPSTALLLDQCHSVSHGVARRHGSGRRWGLIVLTVSDFWSRAR